MNLDKFTSKIKNIPALKLLGVEPVYFKNGEVALKLPFNENLCNSLGIVQGGFITAVADAAGGWALISSLPRGYIAPTIEFKINFLRPVNADIIATGRVIHKTTRIGTAYIEVSFETGELTAVAIGSYRIVSPKENRK